MPLRDREIVSDASSRRLSHRRQESARDRRLLRRDDDLRRGEAPHLAEVRPCREGPEAGGRGRDDPDAEAGGVGAVVVGAETLAEDEGSGGEGLVVSGGGG